MKRSFAVAIVVLALGASAAQAGNKPPAGPTLELSGTLSQYVPATKQQNGSVTMSIAAASLPGYAGSTVTLTVSKSTKVVGHKIHDGDTGTVKIAYYGTALSHPSLSVPVTTLNDQS